MMQLIDIQVQDDRGRHRLAVPAGESLLKSLQSQDVLIGSICGGRMACGICHIFITPAGGEFLSASDGELEVLECSLHFKPEASRLACQIQVGPALTGAFIEIAPEE